MYPVLMCVVYAVSVSPFHVPVVKPVWSCGAFFEGCGRPSIQMVMGARVSHPPSTHALILPVSGSFSLQIFRLNGPAAICHCVWNQQMRSGMEMVDCEKLRALARPASLNGSPAQSSGFGPAPRSIPSSWFLEVQDPDRSISASAGKAADSNIAPVRKI